MIIGHIALAFLAGFIVGGVTVLCVIELSYRKAMKGVNIWKTSAN